MQEDSDKLAKVLGIAKINELTIDQGSRSGDVGDFQVKAGGDPASPKGLRRGKQDDKVI